MTHSFMLFVSGDTPRARNATIALRALCDKYLRGHYEIDVIDVLAHPDQAEQHRIIVTPAILKLHPPPPRRAVGDMRDVDKMLHALELQFGVELLS